MTVIRRGESRTGTSYKDPIYNNMEARLEQEFNLPSGIMGNIRTKGERSNSDQVSSAGAKSVYQVIPKTRALFLKRYGVDAYAGPEQAARVAALHLKESFERGATYNRAVREYHGGPDPKNWGPINDAYVGRAGNGGSPSRQANEAQVTAPLPKLTAEQILNTNPADLGDTRRRLAPQRPLGPQGSDPALSAAAKQARHVASLTGGKGIMPGAEYDDTTVLDEEVANVGADVAEQTADSQISGMERFNAAVGETWLLAQVMRQAEAAHPEADPGYHEDYIKNWQSIEGFAETDREVQELRTARSRDELGVMQARMVKDRETQKMIHGGGHGTLLTLGSAILDPAALLMFGGIGKGFQIAGIGSRALAAGRAGTAAVEARAAVAAVEPIVLGGAPTGRAGLKSGVASTTIPGSPALPAVIGREAVAAIPGNKAAAVASLGFEGGVGNVAFTGMLDASGKYTTSEDYGTAALFGIAAGVALSPLLLRGKVDNSVGDWVAREEAASLQREGGRMAQAAENLGPNADGTKLAAEVERLATEEAKDQLRFALADIPDELRLLSNDPDRLITADPALKKSVEDRHDLVSIADNAERNTVGEHTARSEAIIKANPVDVRGTKTILASAGMESAGLRLLNSESPNMKATSMVLLEGTTGAGGRRRTAAMAQAQREKVYNQHMMRYDDLYHMYRKGEGAGVISDAVTGAERTRFNNRVFYELERRGDSPPGTKFDAHPAVNEAADMFERGMNAMRLEQQHVDTVGAARLGDTSRGYFPHRMQPAAVLALTPAQLRKVRSVLSSQFVDARNGFDQKFSDLLAVKYLEKAMARGQGSYDVPMNLHSPEAADIVRDSLEAMNLGADEVEKLMGKYSRGGAAHTKRRLRLDMQEDIGDGKKLGDLFNKDVPSVFRAYARRVSGEVALAQFGIMGKKGLNVLRKAGQSTGATGPELESFDQIAAEFLNTPYGSHNHKYMDNIRIATSLSRLGGMGFTQFAETANGIAALGVHRVFGSIAAVPRLIKEVSHLAKGGESANPILQSIDTYSGALGLDDQTNTRLFDVKDNEIQLYGSEHIGVGTRALRAMGNAQASLSGHRMILSVQVRGMAEQIVRKAITFARNGGDDVALNDMGINAELRETLRANMDKIATFGPDGKLMTLDLRAGDISPHHLKSIVDGIERGASQIVQRTYIGERGKWAHDGLLKMLTQFRTFSITSVEKQWGRSQMNYGAMKSTMYLMGAMSFAVPIHIARVQAKMFGMSRSEREKYAEDNLTVARIGRATINYASGSGLLGDVLDVGGGFASALGGDMGEDFAETIGSRGQGQGKLIGGVVAPGVGLLEDVWAGVHGDGKKLVKAMPFGNLPYLAPAVNAVTGE